MPRRWKVVLHEEAWDFSDSLRKRDRRRLRMACDELKAHPFAEPDREVRAQNERTLSVREIKGFTIYYWIDLLVAEVVVVEIEKT